MICVCLFISCFLSEIISVIQQHFIHFVFPFMSQIMCWREVKEHLLQVGPIQGGTFLFQCGILYYQDSLLCCIFRMIVCFIDLVHFFHHLFIVLILIRWILLWEDQISSRVSIQASRNHVICFSQLFCDLCAAVNFMSFQSQRIFFKQSVGGF